MKRNIRCNELYWFPVWILQLVQIDVFIFSVQGNQQFNFLKFPDLTLTFEVACSL